MPNIFDQFDAFSVAPNGTNPFDAFDANVFDQFDEPVPSKFPNLPGNLKLDPLQRVKLQTRLQDPENPSGQDNTFLTALSQGGSPVAFAKNLATLPFVAPVGLVGEALKPVAAPIMNALAEVGEADTPILDPKGEPSGADVALYQLGLAKQPDNYQPDEYFQPGQPMLPKELFPYADENQKGILSTATRAVLGMSTPENVLLAGAAPLAPEVIGGGFLTGTTASIPDSLERMAKATNADDFKEAATELGLSIGMAALMAHGLIPRGEPVMTPEEAAANRAEAVAPTPNTTKTLPSETPFAEKIDDLAAAVKDLQDTLRARLPVRGQQTANAPSESVDDVIRNVFPTEVQPIPNTASKRQPNSDSPNITKPLDPHARQVTAKPIELAREARVSNDTESVRPGAQKLTTPIGDLRAAGMKDAHHVIQDAAVRELPRYNSNHAPGVRLPGPSTAKGTLHNVATSVQRKLGGGTYAAERRIGYKAIRQAGYNVRDARQIMEETDAYFNSIGVWPSTPTRIPGNRR